MQKSKTDALALFTILPTPLNHSYLAEYAVLYETSKAWQGTQFADLERPRPVPLAAGWSHAQLKFAISHVPVEGRANSFGELPHEGASPLAKVEGLITVVEEHIAR